MEYDDLMIILLRQLKLGADQTISYNEICENMDKLYLKVDTYLDDNPGQEKANSLLEFCQNFRKTCDSGNYHLFCKLYLCASAHDTEAATRIMEEISKDNDSKMVDNLLSNLGM